MSLHSGKVLSKENVENVTRELGPDFVIKTPTRISRFLGKDSPEYLKQTRDDYLLLKKYVPGFVPETVFIRTVDEEEKPTNCIIQQRLKGKMRPLHEVADEELRDSEVAKQLLEFVRGVVVMDKATGKIPDMFGRPINPLNPRFYNPRYADNILLVEGKAEGKRIFLTDVGAITEHAEKTNIHHRISMKLMRRNLKKFKIWLEAQSTEGVCYGEV